MSLPFEFKITQLKVYNLNLIIHDFTVDNNTSTRDPMFEISNNNMINDFMFLKKIMYFFYLT